MSCSDRLVLISYTLYPNIINPDLNLIKVVPTLGHSYILFYIKRYNTITLKLSHMVPKNVNPQICRSPPSLMIENKSIIC